MQNQTADVSWKSGRVPVSGRFDDPYFSLENGLEETRHVFLEGNDLPGRFDGPVHIAELGFGTGLNFLTTVLEWQAAGTAAPLRFTSFEAFPLTGEDMDRALGAFDAFATLGPALVRQWDPTGGSVDFMPGVTLTVLPGDARVQVPAWGGVADAWYLDGFSPAKNPELWGADLMQAVADHTAPGGTFATYTAAGFVRRGLEHAGFSVQRVPGFGRKRHMSRGVLAP